VLDITCQRPQKERENGITEDIRDILQIAKFPGRESYPKHANHNHKAEPKQNVKDPGRRLPR